MKDEKIVDIVNEIDELLLSKELNGHDRLVVCLTVAAGIVTAPALKTERVERLQAATEVSIVMFRNLIASLWDSKHAH